MGFARAQAVLLSTIAPDGVCEFSGYQVAPDLVLTTGHFPAGSPLTVTFPLGPAPVEGERVWVGPGDLDAALVRLRTPVPMEKSVRFARLVGPASGRWVGAGYPRGSRVTTGNDPVRESAGLGGQMLPAGGMKRGWLELTLDAPCAPEDWAGVSGSAVFVDGALVGLLSTVTRPFRGERGYAVPAWRLLEDPSFSALVGPARLSVLDLDPTSDALHSGELPVPHSPSPANLLQSHYGVVPFSDAACGVDLQELAAWAGDEDVAVSVRLYLGKGGAGKTRLAMELCRRLREGTSAWRAGFWSEGDPIDLGPLLDGARPTLVVLDYAEMRLQDARRLLLLGARHLQRRGKEPMRILLLARELGDWWRGLLADEDTGIRTLLGDAPVAHLQPVAWQGDDRRTFACAAAAAFAQALGTPEVAFSPPSDLGDPLYGQPLYLAMLALLGVLGERASGPAELLQAVLDRETGFWRRGLRQVQDDRALTMRVERFGQTVAALTLLGGVPDEAAARKLTERVGDLPAGDCLPLLRDLYPGDPRQPRAAYLGGLEPDRLGEALVLRLLTGNGRDLVARVLDDADQHLLRHAFIVLGRIVHQAPPLVTEIFSELLSGAHLAERAITAVEALIALGSERSAAELGSALARALERGGSIQTAREMEDLLPEYSVSLAPVAIWVARQRVAAATDPFTKAHSLDDLSIALNDVGAASEAVGVGEQAVALYRSLARTIPLAVPELAKSLNNHSNRLAEVGRFEEALEVAREAVKQQRAVVKKVGEPALEALASLLMTESIRLAELHRDKEALPPAWKALTIMRRLAARPDSGLRMALATKLDNASIRLGTLGKGDEAAALAKEALALVREEARQNPDAYLPDLARVLNNLSVRFAELGQGQEALDAIGEAVEHLQVLIRQAPQAFGPLFARSLLNLANRLGDAGRYREALVHGDAAVGHLRRLIADSSGGTGAEVLANALVTVHWLHMRDGRAEAGLAPIAEASMLFRELAPDWTGSFAGKRAIALLNLAVCCRGLGQRDKACDAATEAVRGLRQLVTEHRADHLPEFARGLHLHATLLEELGQPEASLTATEEAVKVEQELMKMDPDRFMPAAADSLERLVARLGAAEGRAEDQLSAELHLLQLYRQLLKNDPRRFQIRAAVLLNNVAIKAGKLGLREQSIRLATEALGHYLELAQSAPETYKTDLIRCAKNLANHYWDANQQDQAQRIAYLADGLESGAIDPAAI